MVIQAILLLDTLDKDVNSFSMRVRHVLVLHKHFMFLKLASVVHKSITMTTPLGIFGSTESNLLALKSNTCS